MNILVFNRGSSSLKASLYDLNTTKSSSVEPIWSLHFENHTLTVNGEKKENVSIEDTFNTISETFKEQTIDCIGHRIVHGGRKYLKSALIDKQVKEDILEYANLAPLHNQDDLETIEWAEKNFPEVKQIAVFDTSFHHTISNEARAYPGPYSWFEEGIFKYGFHGISFSYATKRSEEILKNASSKTVICHLGSGASLCATNQGKSVDTTMGFTPLDGLMMSTRSGSVDPGILLYLTTQRGVDPKVLFHTLYHESGLLGFSKISADMKTIIEKGNESAQAKLTLDLYLHRLTSLIGSMIVSLRGIETLIFTGGIGENAPLIRERSCEALSFLGVEIDPQKNLGKEDREISTDRSKVKVLVIYAKEELEIARQCLDV